MSIVQMCLGCNAKYKLEQRLVGRRMFCKRCHTVFTVGESASGQTPPHGQQVIDSVAAKINFKGTTDRRQVVRPGNHNGVHQDESNHGHHAAKTGNHNGDHPTESIHGHSDLIPVSSDQYEESDASGMSKSGSGGHIRAVVQNEQDIMKLDVRTLCVLVAELMGYSEIVVDDHNVMHGLLDGILVRVPNYVSESVHTNELLTRIEWGGIAYALRHEPVGSGEHYGFYLKGAHVLGPSRAIVICRGFLLAALQSVNKMKTGGHVGAA